MLSFKPQSPTTNHQRETTTIYTDQFNPPLWASLTPPPPEKPQVDPATFEHASGGRGTRLAHQAPQGEALHVHELVLPMQLRHHHPGLALGAGTPQAHEGAEGCWLGGRWCEVPIGPQRDMHSPQEKRQGAQALRGGGGLGGGRSLCEVLLGPERTTWG